MKQAHVVGTVLVFMLVLLASCAPAGHTPQQYGFLYGILHGFIFLFALIGKLFGMDVGLYAENNTGFTYWAGFIVGFLILGGGGLFSRR